MILNETLLDDVEVDEVSDNDNSQVDTSDKLMLNIHILKKSRELTDNILWKIKDIMNRLSFNFEDNLNIEHMSEPKITDKYFCGYYGYGFIRSYYTKLKPESFYTVTFDYLKMTFNDTNSISNFLIRLLLMLKYTCDDRLFDITISKYDYSLMKKEVCMFTISDYALRNHSAHNSSIEKYSFPCGMMNMYKLLLGWPPEKLIDYNRYSDDTQIVNLTNLLLSSNIANHLVKFNLFSTGNILTIVDRNDSKIIESRSVNGTSPLSLTNIFNQNGKIFPLWFFSVFNYYASSLVQVSMPAFKLGNIFIDGELNPKLNIQYVNDKGNGKQFYCGNNTHTFVYNILRTSDMKLLSRNWFNEINFTTKKNIFIVRSGLQDISKSFAYMDNEGNIIGNKWFYKVGTFNPYGYAAVSDDGDSYYIINEKIEKISDEYKHIVSLIRQNDNKDVIRPMFKVNRISDGKSNYIMSDWNFEYDQWFDE